jgi:hypothetical protein
VVTGGAGRSLARSSADGADEIEEDMVEAAEGEVIGIVFRLIPCKT